MPERVLLTNFIQCKFIVHFANNALLYVHWHCGMWATKIFNSSNQISPNFQIYCKKTSKLNNNTTLPGRYADYVAVGDEVLVKGNYIMSPAKDHK